LPDVFTKRKRSEVMARIRGRGNKGTEAALAKLLRVCRITGWRRQQVIRIDDKVRRARLRGRSHFGMAKARRPIGPELRVEGSRPTNIRTDFIFPSQRVAVFVDGCFWHGCPKHCKIPAGNRPFWKKKFAANKSRDRRVNRELRKLGWCVIRIWEHELGKGRGQQTEFRRQKVVERIRTILR